MLKEKVTIAEYHNASTAARNKLLIGDVFQSITLKDPDDRTKTKTFTMTRQYEILDLLFTVRKGDSVVFNVLREGVSKDVTIVFNNDAYFVKYA